MLKLLYSKVADPSIKDGSILLTNKNSNTIIRISLILNTQAPLEYIKAFSKPSYMDGFLNLTKQNVLYIIFMCLSIFAKEIHLDLFFNLT
jgi:hypothetical protein